MGDCILSAAVLTAVFYIAAAAFGYIEVLGLFAPL